MAEKNFKRMLHDTLNEMREYSETPETRGDFCVGIYVDDNWAESAIVMFMELGRYTNMHEAMKDLHNRLSAKLGYPVSICHNSPTDQDVLVQFCLDDSADYVMEDCCRVTTINRCLRFLINRTGYSHEIQAIALGAEAYAEMTGKTVVEILEALDWNRDPQTQLINLFIKAHKSTQQ